MVQIVLLVLFDFIFRSEEYDFKFEKVSFSIISHVSLPFQANKEAIDFFLPFLESFKYLVYFLIARQHRPPQHTLSESRIGQLVGELILQFPFFDRSGFCCSTLFFLNPDQNRISYELCSTHRLLCLSNLNCK